MPDSGPTSERLEVLQERWEAEPESRVFLQLADEYRRLGRLEEAAQVLEAGLAANPHHLAAQVALGRCRLDLGAADEAAELLERVVESDPTQMVAYRLLVEAYLRQGRPDEARQRLRVYSLLNDADPEIAELRRRIGELDRQPTGGPAEPAAAPPPEPAPDAANEPWAEASDEPVPRPAEPPPAVPAASGTGTGAPDGEPFPGLAEPASRRRYLEALGAGGVFEVEATPGPRTRAPDEVFDLDAPGSAPGPDLAALLDGAPAAPEAPPPARPPEEGGRPTVTLGRLYLRQGHTREAEEILREVLAREPGNEEARRVLEELGDDRRAAPPPAPEEAAADTEAPAPAALEARDLLAGYPEGEGLTGRKRYVLERYLERLRGGARNDVH